MVPAARQAQSTQAHSLSTDTRPRPTPDGYGLYSLVFQRFPEPVGIIAPVGQQPLRGGQTAQQGYRAGVVADLACGHEKPDRAAIGIGDGVQLCVHAAFRSTDLATAPPFMDGPPLPPISV